MAIAPPAAAELSTATHSPGPRWPRIVLSIFAGLLVLGLLGLFLLGCWEYRREKLVRDLGKNLSSTAVVGSFRQLYFPHPGYVAENIVLTHRDTGDQRPWLTTRRLTVTGTYFGMLMKPDRVLSLDAEQLFIRINAGQSRKGHQIGSGGGGWKKTVIDHFIADGAVVEIETAKGKPPLRFACHHLSLRYMGGTGPLNFDIALTSPLPPGEVRVSGQFGPLNTDQPGLTHLQGSYSLRNAELGVFPGIAGTVSSNGRYTGQLNHLSVAGTAATPDFSLKSVNHPMPLRASFETVLNASTGDVLLKSVDTLLARTNITWQGRIATVPGHPGKTTSVSAVSPNAQIEDLFRLFDSSRVPPVDGPIAFRTHVELPQGSESFLKRVRLAGRFGLNDAQPARPETRSKVDLLSERALGNKNRDLDPVLSDLSGAVVLRHGVADFSDLVYSLPGAQARLHGTYSLLDKGVDLHGTLRMQANVSQATTGFKSILMKLAVPFYRRKYAGTDIPVTIEGSYASPVFKVGPKARK